MSTKSATPFLEVWAALKKELGTLSGQELKKYKIGRNQMLVMSNLIRYESLTTSDLADLTQSDPASTTRTVQALEKVGWIKKVSDPDDQRRTLIELSAKGKKHAVGIHEIRETLNEKIKATLTTQELNELIRLTQKIVDSLQENKKTGEK